MARENLGSLGMAPTEGEGNVRRPRIAAWDQAAASRGTPARGRRQPVDRAQRRADEQARILGCRRRELIFEAERRFGVSLQETEIGSNVECWLRRLKLFDSWEAVTSDKCLAVRAVPMSEIMVCAVRNPLRQWSLVLSYMSGAKDDSTRIYRHLPWLEDCEPGAQKSIVAHLKHHQVALLTVETESIARILMAASKPAYFISWRLYSPQRRENSELNYVVADGGLIPEAPVPA